MNGTAAAYRFIDEPDEASKTLAGLATAGEIAVDLEADSLHSYEEKICLIQISTSAANFIIDPFTCAAALPLLGGILSDRRVLKVFHGGDYDIRLFKKGHGFEVAGIFDTMVAAQFSSRARFGLAPLLEEEFGVVLDKKLQRADWSQRPLTEEMLRYAALDTTHLLPLKERLEDDLRRLGRINWVREECALLEKIEPGGEKPPTAYGVKGAGRLSPEGRGRLQRLLAIRDDAARDLDRPPFKVLSNGLLLQLSAAPPATQEEIPRLGGASRKILGRLSPRIYEALSLPLRTDELLPARGRENGPLTAEQKKKLQSLKMARTSLEKKLALPPGLVSNSATLEKLCRMETAEALRFIGTEFKNWQRAVAGELFAGVLEADGF